MLVHLQPEYTVIFDPITDDKPYLAQINQNFQADSEQPYCQSSKHDQTLTVGGANVWNKSSWIFKYLSSRSTTL